MVKSYGININIFIIKLELNELVLGLLYYFIYYLLLYKHYFNLIDIKCFIVSFNKNLSTIEI